MELTTIMPATLDEAQAEEIAMLINEEHGVDGVEAAVMFDSEAGIYDLILQIPDDLLHRNGIQFLFYIGELVGMLYYNVPHNIKTLNPIPIEAALLN